MAAILWVPFISLTFLLTVSGSSLAVKEAQYVGCFPDNHVKNNEYYESRHLLTWEECLQFCFQRLTMYAGVQMEHGSSSDNNCYCGNNLGSWLSTMEVSSAACRPCQDNNDRYCGGDQVMSVYQIRQNTPFTVLIATDFGVKIYADDSTVLTTAASVPGTASVKYLYDEEEMFFISGIKIYRSFFNYVTMNYNSPGRISLHNFVVLDFDVDWVQKGLFWMNGDNDYSIYQTDLEGSKATKILQRNYFLRNLIVDPYSRMFFFVEYENKLYSYSIDNGTLHNYYNGKIHVTKIKKMAVDVKNEVIYVIGAEEDGALQLLSVDYEDTKGRMVYQGPQLTDPTALDIYNGEVIWVNHEDLKYSLYRCKLTPRCQPENIVMAYQSLEKINDINIYHPERQTPGVKFLCRQKGCSHGCRAESLFTVRCDCPPGMTIGREEVTCQGVEDSTRKDRPMTLPTVTDHLDVLGTSQPKYIDTKPSIIDKRHLEYNSGRVDSKQHVLSAGIEDSFKADAHIISHFQFFVVFCFFSLFLLLSIVIYLQVRRIGEQERVVSVGQRCRIPEPEDGANTYVEIINMSTKNTDPSRNQ